MGKNKREIIIDGRELKNRAQAHEYLQSLIGCEYYTGKSLDALHDALTSVCEDTVLIVREFDSAQQALEGYADRLMRVLVDSALENPSLSLTLE